VAKGTQQDRQAEANQRQDEADDYEDAAAARSWTGWRLSYCH
jgi:hypothetical protein